MYEELAGTTINTAQLETEWQSLRKQLHALAVSIATERERGNVAGVKAMLPYFQRIAMRMTEINRQLYNTEFTEFDNFILSTGEWIEDTVKALPNAIAAVPVGIGTGLIKAAIPFAALWLGYQYLSKRGTL
jgi:hypothetical protein